MTTTVKLKVEYLHPGKKVVGSLASPETGAVFAGTMQECSEVGGEMTFSVHEHADLVVKEVD